MRVYDVGIGWANPVDQRFVEELKPALRKRRLSFFEITFHNLSSSFERIVSGDLSFSTFIDRSSDDHPAYFLLAELLRSRGSRVINNPYSVVRFAGKAALHQLFLREGIPVLSTVILSSGRHSKKRLKETLASFSVPFVVKPAHGGAGEGVTMSAKNVDDLVRFIKDNAPDDALVQPYVIPSHLNGRTAWFRPLHVCGRTLPLWWDPKNKFYHPFGRSLKEQQVARRLETLMAKIANLTGMELFSIEAALTHDKKFVVIDYLNHPIDLNSREVVSDGLPPETLELVAGHLAKSMKQQKSRA